MQGWKLPVQVGKTHQRSEQNLGLYSGSLERRRRLEEHTVSVCTMQAWKLNNCKTALHMRLMLLFFFFTLSDEQPVTLEAAMMKSRISMVAPGRPILKNLGLQCFMMVFTMSWRNNTVVLNTV